MKNTGQRKPNHLLRQQRLLPGWSLQRVVEELCALCASEERLPGVNAAMVSNWETGVKKPSPFYQERLCKLYHLSADQLGFIETPSYDGDKASSLKGDAIDVQNSTLTIEAPAFPDLGDNNLAYPHFSRRTALLQLLSIANIAAIPAVTFDAWERLSLAGSGVSAMNTDAFRHFQKVFEGCWGLCNAGDFEGAQQILSSFLPRMIQIAAKHPEAATLAAHGLRLQSLLMGHQLRTSDMVALCVQAVEYALLSKDSNALSAALNGLAVAFKYNQQPEASFKAYQEALYYSEQASPLFQSRVYAGAAATFAQRGRKQEALFYIGLAYEQLPEHPEDEPDFFTADNGLYMLSYYEGLMYLSLAQPQQALNAFERYKHSATIPERNRLEIINHMGKAAIMANNLEQYAMHLEEGLSGAIALKSKKRFDEAISIYRYDMPRIWLDEPLLKQAAERFELDRYTKA
ncbi:MAG TPA: helix-turn-helix transcriptional regulator [Ktedonobacteraceae bacterium]|jgi:tetratricopeptide (TPR) repeat protein|nr:helix-turn-helix transcriptional regulator [Ktedonobacteraceae bacterium]